MRRALKLSRTEAIEHVERVLKGHGIGIRFSDDRLHIEAVVGGNVIDHAPVSSDGEGVQLETFERLCCRSGMLRAEVRALLPVIAERAEALR